MSYLHANNIVHKDINTKNVLFDGKKITMVDFGAAMYKSRSCNSYKGNINFLSPEALKGKYCK